MSVKFGLLLAIGLMLTAATPQGNVQKLSLDFTTKTLFEGKSVTGTGVLYYSTSGGKMVTQMKTPLKQLIVTNSTGEYKSYDFENNQVTLMQGAELSSKNSFVYSFLSGKIKDMGISELGFKLSDTRFEDGLVISVYSAPTNRSSFAHKIEIAHENYLPIYVGLIDNEGMTFKKTYYTNYQDVSYIKMPFTVTEIDYLSEVDSTITRRSYGNLKTNQTVSNEWFDFVIPTDAEVLTPKVPEE